MTNPPTLSRTDGKTRMSSPLATSGLRIERAQGRDATSRSCDTAEKEEVVGDDSNDVHAGRFTHAHQSIAARLSKGDRSQRAATLAVRDVAGNRA
jgi:hypothetical protein